MIEIEFDDPLEPKFVQRHFRHYTGWFKIWRQIFNNDIWATCPHAWFRVFFAIIGCARYEEQELRIAGEKIIAPPGSLTIGTHEFALFCGISRQQLRSALEYLVSADVITIRATARFTLVTICNWDAYQSESGMDQGSSNQPNNQLNNQLRNHLDNQPNNQRVTTSKEVKKYKKTTMEDLAKTPLVRQLAERLHARHPIPRRDTPGEAASQIAGILKATDPSERTAICELIDTNHGLWCATFGWTKDGGEYAKGLVNWLAPTKRRWAEPPTIVGAAVRPTVESIFSVAPTAGEEYAERMYALHPKKKDRDKVVAEVSLIHGKSANPDSELAEIERVHGIWCRSDEWTEHRFVPTLANWLSDRGWTGLPQSYRPPSVAKRSTEGNDANAYWEAPWEKEQNELFTQEG